MLRSAFEAQALAQPSERRVSIDSAESDVKLDMRADACADRIQLIAARLYRGQATNFRPPGSSFALALLLPS
ncbi:hypothetical protein [Thauera sp. 63]|uniref:hypothetical protein n=1 Tax=Thauera sp. 63 TaxID=497321 RepID=UPI0002CDF8F8|nr:hypothetical protein [Thauera sp. 63]ENO78554.1 hypothetical protein C664_07313 [Thauera sp. 63]